MADNNSKGQKGRNGQSGMRRRMPQLMRLEQRLMFDGAAVDAVAAATELAQADSSDAAARIADLPDTLAVAAGPDRRELVFVDAAIENVDAVLAELSEDREVILVEVGEDGLALLAKTLSGREGVDAVHIIGHGAEGVQRLGSSEFSAASLSENRELLAAIGDSLDDDGDILLYGCYVVDAGDVSFVAELAALTGADIAASTDATGNVDAGGDWELEYASGLIETQTLFADGDVSGFSGLLAAATVNGPGEQSVAEDGALSFSGLFAVDGGDADSIGEIIFVSGSGELRDANANLVTSGGSLSQIGDATAIQNYLNGLTYTPDADSNATATFIIRVDESSAEQSANNSDWDDFTELTVNVTEVDDKPTLAGNASLAAVDEDGDPAGATVSSLFGSLFADVDGDTFAGIAISADGSNAGQGVWEYRDGAGDWVAVGSVANNNALLLGAATLVRFNPADNYNGTPGSLTLRAIDSSTGQTFTAAGSPSYATSLSGSDTSGVDRLLQTSVNPVNDAPTTSEFSLSVDKNVTLTGINITSNAADVDGVGDIESYSVTVLPDASAGVLQLSNGTPVTAGGTLVVAQASALQFVPVTNYTGPATFSFTATDGETTSNASVATITVTAFNEPPVVTVPAGPLEVAEDSADGLTISGAVSVSDVDAGDSTVEVTISTNMGGTVTLATASGLTFQDETTDGSSTVTVQGTLTAINAALDTLVYRPALNFNGTETITVASNDLVDDDSKTDSGTFNVSVTPVDDEPALTGPAILASIAEDSTNPDGATVSSLVVSVFSDVDGDSLAGIAVSANTADAANGVWQYSVNDGETWADVGGVSETSALLLSASAKLRFAPVADWSGTPAPLTFRAIDNSGSRTFTGASRETLDVTTDAAPDFSTSNTLGTSVTPVDDLFTVVNDRAATVNEGATVTIGSSTLQITDVEAAATQVVYAVTSLPTAAGELRLNGVALADNGTFTQDDINNDRVTFAHNGTEPSATGATLTISYSVTDVVDDNGTPIGSIDSRSLTINVSPVNDVPALVLTDGAVQIGQTLAIDGDIFAVVDPDNTNAQLVFRIEALPTEGSITIGGAPAAIGSTFSYADVLAGNVVTYAHDGGSAGTDTFSVRLRDGAGGVVDATAVTITVGDVNTAPTIGGSQVEGGNVYLPLDEGETDVAVFPNTTFSDAQTAAEDLVVAVLSLPDSAEAVLQYDGTEITQADVDAGFTFNAVNRGLLTIDHVSVNELDPVDVNFTISVTDNDDTPLSNTATVFVELQAINDDPVGTAGTQVITEGQTVILTAALLNATDVDSPDGELTFRLESRPTSGFLFLDDVPLGDGATFTLIDIQEGRVRYTHDGTPDANDAFTVTLRDGSGGLYQDGTLTPLVVNFTIGEPVAFAPGDDSFTILERIDAGDPATTISASQLLSNDDGASLTISNVQDATNGVAVLNGDQSVTFTADVGFEGTASFTYTVTDGTNQGTATVFINVFGIDANNDSVVAQFETPLSIDASALLANDVGNQPLTITAVGQGSNGSVTHVGNIITYTPGSGFRGLDAFTYTATDADGDEATATVRVDVRPVAVDDSYSVLENASVTFSDAELLGDDRGTGLEIVSVSDPVSGTVVLNGTEITFTPGSAESGAASFTYTIRDDFGAEDTATVTLFVYDLRARDDSYSTPQNTQIVLADSQLLGNDSGNPAISIQSVSPPASSSDYTFVRDAGDGTITITPVNDFSGTISFTYTLVDGDGETDTASVVLLVSDTSEPNNPPVANPDSFITIEDTLLEIGESQLLANDSGDAPLNVISVQSETNGTVELVEDVDGDGIGDTILFTPAADFAGTASFTYTIRDATTGDVTTATASVTVVTLAQNDSPALTTGTQSDFNEGAVVTVTSAALNTTDVDNTTAELVYTLTELPDKSTDPDPDPSPGALYFDPSPGNFLGGDAVRLRLNESFTQADLDAGRIKFAHDGRETHVVTFKFTVTDGSDFELSGTATLQDTPVNDQPVLAIQSQVVVIEGETVVIDNTYIRTDDVDLDVDGNVADGLTLSVTDLPTQGTLFLDTNNDGTFDAEITEVNKAATTFTQAQIDAGRLRYEHGDGEVSTDSFTLELDDNSGQANATTVQTVQVGITPLNDDPTISSATGDVFLYEGQQHTLSAADLLDAADVDNEPDEVQYRITTAPSNGQIIRLDVSGETLLTTGVVLDAGSAFTLEEVEDGRIVFRHDGYETTTDTLVFALSDSGGGNEPVGTITFDIEAVNDAPTIAAPASLSVSEDQPLAVTGIVISDADAGSAVNLVATLTVTNGTLSATATDSDDADSVLPTVDGAGTTSLTITGSLADINATLASLTYTGSSNFVGSDSIVINVKDGGNTGVDPDDAVLNGLTFTPALTDDGDTNTSYEQANATIAVTVNPVNDAPVNSVPSAQTVNEDAPLVFSADNSNAISISDPDINDPGTNYTARVTLTVQQGTLTAAADGAASVSGSGTSTLVIEGSAADINATLDGLIYQGLADFYGEDTLGMTTADLGNFGLGGEKTAVDSAAITITVAPVNDAPTSEDISETVAEDSTLTFTLPFSDTGENEVEDSVLTNRFRIVTIPANGVLKASDGTILNTEDQLITVAQATNMTFEPDDNFNGSVSFTFRAVDAGDLESATQTASITVTAVNDAPSLTGGGDEVNYTEGAGPAAQGTPVVLNTGQNIVLSDQELTVESGIDSFASATLTAVRSDGADSTDRFWFSNAVTLSGTANGATITVDSTVVGTVTNNSSTGTLLVTFNSAATQADVEAVMESITYASTDDDPDATVTVAMTFNDGNGGAQGSGGSLSSNALSFTVDITPANDSPSLTTALALSAIREDAGDDDGSGADGDDDATDNTNNAGQTVATLANDAFFDPDGGDALAGIVIIGNNSLAVQGIWEYSIDAGATWTAVPTDLTTTNGLYLDTADLLRFVPDQNANNNTFGGNGGTPALTVKAVDTTTLLTSGATGIDANGGVTSEIAAESVQLTASVLPVNDTPAINDLDGDTPEFTEGIEDAQGAAIILDAGTSATLADIELTVNSEANFNGAILTVADITTNTGELAGQPVTTDFYFIKSGVNNVGVSGTSALFSGERIYNDGSSITFDGTTVATITENSQGTGRLILTFNDAATSDAVNAILQNTSFNSSSSSLEAGDKTVTVTFNDGGRTGIDPGLTADASSEEDSVEVTISIIPTNDSPLLAAGATVTATESDEAGTTSPQTVLQLLGGDNFSDPDGVDGNALAGVLVTAFDNQGIGEWEVSLDGTNWTTLTSLNGGSAISESSALALSGSTQIRFAYNANANTQDSTQPSITVFGVEAEAPTGATNTADTQIAEVVDFSTDFGAGQVRRDLYADTAESRIAQTGVAIEASITATNDEPVIAGTAFAGTVLESPIEGQGTTPQQLLTGVTVEDLDIATTGDLDVFGAGTITVTLTGRVAGDVFSLEGSPAGVASTSGDDVASGSYVIDLTTGATLAQVKAILEAIRFENTDDNPPAGARSYTVVLNDGNNLDQDGDTAGGPAALDSNTLTGSITITGVNDPPSLSATGATQDLIENDEALSLFSSAAVDAIQPDQTIIELKLTVSGLEDGATEKLTIDGTEIDLVDGTNPTTAGSVAVSVIGGTATVTYTPPSAGLTKAATVTLIDSLAYRHASEDPAAGVRTVTLVSLTDNGAEDANSDATNLVSYNITSTVTVIPVNDPVDAQATVGGTFTEGGTALQFLTGVTVADLDTDQFDDGSLTIALTNYYTGDTLGIADGNGISISGSTISYNDGNGADVIGTFTGGDEANLVITFTATDATETAVAALLGQISYSNSTENPTFAGAYPTRAVTVTMDDGGNSGSGTGSASTDTTPISGTFSVVGINDAPTLTGLDETNGTTYIQAGSAIVIDANAVLADLDLEALPEGTDTPAGNWAGSTLTIQRQTTASADDVFGNTGTLASLSAASGNIVVGGDTIGTYTQSGGVLTFTFNASATTSRVNEALRNITYSNAVTAAGDLAYNSVTLEVTFNDQNSNITDGGTQGTGQDQGSGGALSVTDTIVININRLPEAVADANSVNEGVATDDSTSTSGNVLTGVGNTDGLGADSDDDILAGGRSDELSVVNAKDSSDASFLAVDAESTSDSNGTAITGDYGTLTIGADGSYTYAVDNTDPAVQALAVGETLTDTFTYELSDGQGGFNTADLTITINGTNDAPVITGGPDTADLDETDAGLTASGSLTVSDVDTTDVVTATRTLVVSGTSNRSDPAAPSDAALLAMLTLNPTTILDGTQQGNTLNWSFDSGSEAFGYLAEGETLVLTYTITATDDDGSLATDTETVTITITGTNDTPVITDGADTASLTESDSTLTTTGSMTVTDIDTADTIDVTVESVAVAGTFATSGSTLPLDNATLLAMLGVNPSANLAADTATSGTAFDWTFTSAASGDGAFDFLREDETLILTYTIRATDSSGATGGESTSTTSTVTITTTGTNDTPVITNGADTAAVTETNAQLNASGSMTVTDIDLTDTVTVAVTGVAIDNTSTFDGTVPSALTADTNAALQAMLSVPATSLAANPASATDFTWTFTSGNSGDDAFEFLGKDETLVLVYTITATDNSGATAGEATSTTSTVTITVTGTNDTPDITATLVSGAVTEDTATVVDNPNTGATEAGSYLTAAGSIDFDDLDVTDTSDVTAAFVSSTATSGSPSVSGDLNAALQDLVNTFLISGSGVSAAAQSGTVNWSFALDNGLVQYLSAGETLTATYRITVEDDSGVGTEALPNELSTRTQDVTITISGTNDTPSISVEDGDSAAETLTETDEGLTVSNTLTVTDVDLTNTVSAAVISVSKSGTTAGIVPDDATLQGYLTLASADIIANSATTGSIAWIFNSGSEAFDYLDDGESLELTYTIRVTDSSGATDDQAVVITVTGTNDDPTVSVAPDTYGPTEFVDATDQDLSASGTVSFDDIDASDVTDISVVYNDDISWELPMPGGGSAGTLTAGLVTALTSGTFVATAENAAAPGTTPWTYTANDLALDFLSAGETISFSSTVTATDDSNATDTATVTVTITGTNDAPTVSATATAAITELLDASAQHLTDSGTISFDDIDTNDVVDITSASKNNIAWSGGTIDGALATQLVDGFSVTTVTDNAAPDTTPWSYSVTDADLDFLAAGETITFGYTITATDSQGATATTDVDFTITGTNDAPVLNDTALTLTQAEDDGVPTGAVGTLVSTLVGGITDADTTNPQGIAITATDSDRGTWYYSTDNGANWASFTATGGTARLLLADANTRLYFAPDANWHGSIDPSLTLRAWDASTGSNGGTADLSDAGTSTGGTTAFSTATDTVALTVTPVNDQPTISEDVTLATIVEDTTPAGVALNTLDFGYSDATDDQNDSNTGVLVGGDTSTPFTYLAVVGSTDYTTDQGVWQISTIPSPTEPGHWIDIPASGLSDNTALIFDATSQIRFVPAADFFGTPGTLTVRLADASVDLSAAVSTSDSSTADLSSSGGTDTSGAWSVGTQTIAIDGVTNVNDRPTAQATTLDATTEDNTNPSGATLVTLGFGYSDATDDNTPVTGGGEADTAFGGIAIVGNSADAATQGVWQYQLSGSSVWVTIDSGASEPTDSAAILLPTTASLRFLPNVENYNGTPGDLSIRVSDEAVINQSITDISGSLGETDQWSLVTTLSTSVLPVNDAPGGADKAISLAEDSNYTLLASDFGFTDPVEGDELSSVVITTLATAGALEYSSNGTDWAAVTEGQDVSAADIGNGRLRFMPAADANASPYATFTFQVRDDGGTDNGGVNLDPSANTITFTVTPVNDAPVATGTATLPADSEDTNNPTVRTVDSLFGGNFDDSADDSGTSTANTLAGIAIVGYTADASKGTWEYSSDGNSWTALATISNAGSVTTVESGDFLRFVPEGNWNGAAPTLTVKLIDSSTTVTTGATVDASTSGETTAFSADDVVLSHTVTAVNDAPVASGSATLAAIDEDTGNSPGDTIGDLFSGNFSDATDAVTDGSTANTLAGVAIVANPEDLAKGQWEYRTDGGANWSAVGAVSDSSALTLTTAASLRFVPAPDYNGSAPSLTVRLIDSSTTVTNGATAVDVSVNGGTTAISSGTVQLSTTINAVNDAPVLSATLTSATYTDTLADDTFAVVNGTLTTADVDTGDTALYSITGQSADTSRAGFTHRAAGSYGTLFLNETSGAYEYVPDDAVIEGLKTDTSESFTLVVTDSQSATDSETLTIILTAANDTPELVDPTDGSIAEDDQAATTTDANLSGTLSSSDRDSGDSAAYSITDGTTGGSDEIGGITYDISKVGAYGTLYLNSASGAYAYVKNDAAIEALDSGETASDSFTFVVTDGSGATAEQSYAVDLTGGDDAPTLGTVTAGSITETDQSTAVTEINLSGTLSGSDVDVETLTYGIDGGAPGTGVNAGTVSLAGSYGTLTVNTSTGAYSYVRDVAAVEALNSSDTPSDSFTVTVTDGDGDLVTQTFTVNLVGANDAAVIGGDITGNVVEAGGVNNGSSGTPTATGTLTAADVDDTDNLFVAVTAGTASGAGYGTFGIATDGNWSYTLDDSNSTVQALGAGVTLTDTFIATSTDGTTQTFTVTITGANDTPTVTAGDQSAQLVEAGGVANGTVGTASATIALTKGDLDGTANFDTAYLASNGWSSSDSGVTFTKAGTYGTATLTIATGVVSYALDNDSAATEALDQDDSVSDAFTLQVTDGSATATATASFSITGSNDAPVVSGTFAGAATEGNAGDAAVTATGALSISDVDADDSPGFADVASTAGSNGYGSFALASGTWTYTLDQSAVQDLDAGDTVTDSITYTATDDTQQTITVTITGANDAPVLDASATPTLTAIAEDIADGDNTGTLVSALVGSAITDVDASAVEGIYVTVVDNSNGSWQYDTGSGWTAFDFSGVNAGTGLLLAADEAVRFVPNADYNGSATISYGAWDQTAGSAGDYADISVKGSSSAFSTATDMASIMVNAVVDVTSDTLTAIDEDGSVTASLLTGTGGATADTFEGTPVITAVTQGTNGTVAIIDASAGTVKYTPNADFNGTDSYSYTVTSGGVTETATVTVTVNQVDDPATFGGDTSGSGAEDGGAITGTVTVTDNADGLADPLDFSVSVQATNGTANINAATGEWTYTPNSDYNGSDSFTVSVTDGDGNVETQVISLTATAVADIADDTQSVPEDLAPGMTTNLLFNDSFEGTPVITAVTQGTNGSVVIVGDGSAGTVTYTPNPNFNGTDSYTYTVTSGGVTETATVTVTVTQVNDAATFGGDISGSGAEDTTISGTLTVTDTADAASAPNFRIEEGGEAANGARRSTP